jgi:hypothetical protein
MLSRRGAVSKYSEVKAYTVIQVNSFSSQTTTLYKKQNKKKQKKRQIKIRK